MGTRAPVLQVDSSQRDRESPPVTLFSRCLKAPMTLLILALVGCVFASEVFVGGIVNPAENIMIGPSGATLVAMGAKHTPLIIAGEPWRLVSSVWLHASVIHLLMNGWSLYSVGAALEGITGPQFYLATFLFSGVVSMFASAVLAPGFVTVGASGAVFGLQGVGLVLIFAFPNTCRERMYYVVTVAVNLVSGFLVPFVDNFTHVFGLFVGVLFGLIFAFRFSCYKRPLHAIPVIFASLLLVGLLVGLALSLERRAFATSLFAEWVACIPFPWRNCAVERAVALSNPK